MKTHRSFARLLGASAALFLAAALPSVQAGEAFRTHALHASRTWLQHHKYYMAYANEPVRMTAQPATIKEGATANQEQPLKESDFRSADENNLVNPG